MSLANAILFGTLEEVSWLIEQGANVDDIDEYGFTPLIEAAIANNLAVIQLLLNKQADIHETDASGRTALHWAVDNNNIPLTQLLLEHQADSNAYTTAGQPVLVYPLLRRQTELKKLLYAYGAKLHFAQDFINTKLLGHRFELKGTADIINPKGQFIEISYEGFFLEFSLDIIRESLHRFRYHFSARHLRTYFRGFEQLLNTFSTAVELLHFQRYTINIQDYQTHIDALLKSPVLLLPVGYEGHAIAFLNFKNILIRCDRGENSKKEASIVIYKIGNIEKFNKAFIKTLIYKRQSRAFITAEIHLHLKLQTLGSLPCSRQKTGNCSFANLEAAVFAFFFLIHWQQQGLSWEEAEEKARYIYHEWEEWDKGRVLGECISSFLPASAARKATKANILGAVLFQYFSKSRPQELAHVEKILPILLVKEYQYVLESYLTVYWKMEKTTQGHRLHNLLEECGIKLEV